MPKMAKKPCRHPGCATLTEGKYCEAHKPLHPDRPSRESRGYTSKWKKVSKAYLRKHPLCVHCKQHGKNTFATVVDHVIPHRNDPALMWSESNWQPLCKPCHDKKTWTEDKTPVYSYSDERR